MYIELKKIDKDTLKVGDVVGVMRIVQDFQGYRRKAIYMYYDLLRLHRKADLIS